MVTQVKSVMMIGQRLKVIVDMMNVEAMGVIVDMMNIEAMRVSEGE